MRNNSPARLLEVIRRRRPDLVLLLEPDRRWAEDLDSLQQDYPYRVAQAQDNTYGMLLFSKLPLIDPCVRFLVQKDVPSIRAKVKLGDGSEIWFYGVHPRPPVHGSADGDIELTGSAPRDAELIVVATEISKLRAPVIIAGDFNDVAWSHTTRRFQRLSRTLDPRVGRGLYSTFHARNRLLRFPLDHLFISEHFALAEFEREQDIGSDHFPLCATLVLTPSAVIDQEPPKPDKDDHTEAQEVLVEAAEQARK
jgi:endonuclease/exonuclease/phosphatase (EEP) superfamily protein YafD